MPYIQPQEYVLTFEDEAGIEREHAFYAFDDDHAKTRASILVTGGEGLITAITLSNQDGDELAFEPF